MITLSFGQKRQAIRDLRHIVNVVRAIQREIGLHGVADFTLTIEGETYDRARWAMAHLRVWDEEGGQYVRVHSVYVRPACMDREHFLVRDCPIFRGD